MTAENVDTCIRGGFRRSPSRFNEAAADDRGKRPISSAPSSAAAASMRPRPMTAENIFVLIVAPCCIPRFNEAAADDRGKHCRHPKDYHGIPRLQ